MKSVLAIMMLSSLASGMSLSNDNSSVQCNFVRIHQLLGKCQKKFVEKEDNLHKNPLVIVKKICSKRYDIKDCFEVELATCSNKEDAMTGLETAFNKCDGVKVQETLRKYLAEYYKSIPEQCFHEMEWEKIIPCLKIVDAPQPIQEISYKEGVDFFQNVFNLARKCFKDFIKMPNVESCDGRSGARTFLDGLALYTVPNVVGIDTYSIFLENENIDIIQQTFSSRALRDLLRW